MAPVVTMRQLLEAGVHFGHQTRRWNPKMRRFIHGERNGIYLIDLEQTLDRIDKSYRFVRDLSAQNKTVLFIGTKRQAKDAIRTHAERSRMPYVNERWLGGMLTNFETISKRIGKMREYQRMRAAGDFDVMPKKEALLLSRELAKLERNLHGIRNMDRLPDAVFIVDTGKEAIAVTEARKLGIPVIAVVDTNCDPDSADFIIPGNDDAIRSGDLLCRIIADAVDEGRLLAEKRGTAVAAPAERTAEDEARIATEQAEARAQAAAQAAEREARVSAAQADAVSAPPIPPPIPPPPAPPVAATPAAPEAGSAVPPSTAPNAAAPEAATPADPAADAPTEQES
jgi:small subunit ribosomal protein S2